MKEPWWAKFAAFILDIITGRLFDAGRKAEQDAERKLRKETEAIAETKKAETAALDDASYEAKVRKWTRHSKP